MQVIIPMAGNGQRFADAGYTELKPFIDVQGKPMIQRVIENLDLGYVDHVSFIVSGGEVGKRLSEITSRIIPTGRCEVFILNEKTQGPAKTLEIILETTRPYGEMIVINCDQIIGDFNITHLSEFAKVNEADGVLGAFISSSPKNSYMKLDPNGRVTDVQEKVVISNIATNGLHYWKNAEVCYEALQDMFKDELTYNGEYYIAPSYNYMIREGMTVLPFFYNLHNPIGTPEDLERYLECSQEYKI